MADFTNPIPPISPGEFSPAGREGAPPRRRRSQDARRAMPEPAIEADGEPADPEPEHQLDESA